jgi:hypothetical protein
MLMAKRKKSVDGTIILYIPTWAVRVYAMLAIVLVPWTFYLGTSLPHHHLSVHWDVSWTGLDIGLIIAMTATGICAYLKSMWVVIAAATTGSFLLLDAWFDVLSEHTGSLFHQAMLSAILFEVPLAIMSYSLAAHALRRTKKHR